MDDIRTPYGALSGAQLEVLDAQARGETPLPPALAALLAAATELRHAADAAALDDPGARLWLRAAIDGYDRAWRAWRGPRRAPDVW